MWKRPNPWVAMLLCTALDRLKPNRIVSIQWSVTMVTESTSGETLVASRVGNRVVVYRRLLRFWGRPPLGPTPVFTDNDGTWYVARDGTGTTRMNYIINHMRMLQELESTHETRATIRSRP